MRSTKSWPMENYVGFLICILCMFFGEGGASSAAWLPGHLAIFIGTAAMVWLHGYSPESLSRCFAFLREPFLSAAILTHLGLALIAGTIEAASAGIIGASLLAFWRMGQPTPLAQDIFTRNYIRSVPRLLPGGVPYKGRVIADDRFQFRRSLRHIRANPLVILPFTLQMLLVVSSGVSGNSASWIQLIGLMLCCSALGLSLRSGALHPKSNSMG